MDINKYFSANDLETIEAEVKSVEKEISGEIVPVILENSGRYTIAIYRAAIIGALMGFIITILADRYTDWFTIYDPLIYFAITVLFGIIGAIKVISFPFLRRMLAGKNLLTESVQKKAEEFFLREEVFKTIQRTGILICISLFEKKIIILADKGISEKVDQELWNKIVEEISDDMKSKNYLNGILKAIRKCKDILLENGFSITPDDKDELSNKVRVQREK
ncbi:MAG: TPM domain-containing protein [Ignavibacteriales bacterium]|nr:TPM domain-containing protein [Ignavibacteriales bacterium]